MPSLIPRTPATRSTENPYLRGNFAPVDRKSTRYASSK